MRPCASASSRTTPRSRRWSSAPGEARRERFGDSTDMCSLVNAKSGGCAEDCGFCAQSQVRRGRDAAARDDGARADPRARAGRRGRRRPPLLHGHPGPGARPSATSRRCWPAPGWSPSTPTSSAARRSATCRPSGAKALKEAGIQRVHHNVETAESYYPEVSTHRPLPGPPADDRRGPRGRPGDLRRRHPQPRRDPRAAGRDGLPAGRDQPDQRARSTCSTRGPGTKFGDRELMDPWEAVKWIAIFRLILPEALFRLCGGRVENLGELQATAVKAGLNGVMMGNFLTTLGNTPDEDRAMFEELGLNVARQPDNGANPRPDNRSGWLEGETPGASPARRSPTAEPSADRPRRPALGPLDPAALRAPSAVATVPPGRPRAGAEHAHAPPARIGARDDRDRGAPRRAARLGLLPAHPAGQRPAGSARACSTASRCCCCARTTTSGSPTTRACARRRPTRRCAGASAPGRRGWSRAR